MDFRRVCVLSDIRQRLLRNSKHVGFRLWVDPVRKIRLVVDFDSIPFLETLAEPP